MNISVTTLSKILSGDEPCLFKHWYVIRNKKDDLSKNLISWKMNHNKFVTEMTNKLQKEKGILKREEWIEESLSKDDKILGSVDILHVLGKKVKIYEIKSGSRSSHSHVMQILIYLYLLNKLGIYNEISGVLKYNHIEQEYTLDDIPSEFPKVISENTKILLGKEEPSKIMGGGCRFCEVPCELKE